MAKFSNVVIVILLCLSSITNAVEIEFTDIDRQKFADILFNEIERLDASASDIRNTTKSVSWKEYREVSTKKIVAADSFKELAKALDYAQQGFINSHSSIQLYSSLYNSRKLYENVSYQKGLKLGFEYPNISFFSLKSRKSLTSINGIDLLKEFNKFKNFKCEYAHDVACLDKFVKWIDYGLIDLNLKMTNVFLSQQGDSWKETIEPLQYTPQLSQKEDCADYAMYHSSMHLTHESEHSCILQKNDLVIFKLTKFADWGVSYDDIYCNTPAKKDSLCFDIQTLTKKLEELGSVKLIIDLQGNSGGAENTPLVAVVARQGFYDNLVKYRNSKEMLEVLTDLV